MDFGAQLDREVGIGRRVWVSRTSLVYVLESGCGLVWHSLSLDRREILPWVSGVESE